jgi:hypothetical protein
VYTSFLITALTYGSPVPTTDPSVQVDSYNVGLKYPNGSVILWECPKCEIGKGLSVECGGTYDIGTKIECPPCEKGITFSDKRDRGQCKECRKCQENENKIGECMPSKDTIECHCKTGYYKDKLSRKCMPCSWCCYDTSDIYMSECNIPQVPRKRQCSFQYDKQCSPTSTPTTSTPTTSTPTTSTPTTSTPTTSTPNIPTPIAISDKGEKNRKDVIHQYKFFYMLIAVPGMGIVIGIWVAFKRRRATCTCTRRRNIESEYLLIF